MASVDKPQPVHKILMAEDNEDDYILMRDAFAEAALPVDLSWVKDGEELMTRLKTFSPDLILLDLNMPKKNGREALKEIKADSHLKRFPVVIFSTSGSEKDVKATYDLGANAYMQKPVGFEKYVDLAKALHGFWFGVSKIPHGA